MTNLLTKIKQDSITALKSKGEEKEKLDSLRLLISELEKERIEVKAELTDKQVEDVISRQLKKLGKEIEAYVAVNKPIDKQLVEKELLLSYLPKQLTDEEIRKEVFHAIDLTVSQEIKNPMQYLGANLRGKADMKRVQQILKEING